MQNSGYSSIKFCVISVQISQKHLTITVADGVMRVLCTAFVVTPSNMSKTPSHGATETPECQRCSLWKRRKDKQIKSEWVVWFCFEGTEAEMQRGMWGMWEVEKKPPRKKKETGRRGDSGDVKHKWHCLSTAFIFFFSQWARCWGDVAKIHLKYIWQWQWRRSGGFTVPYSISVISNSCHHKSQFPIDWINPAPLWHRGNFEKIKPIRSEIQLECEM